MSALGGTVKATRAELTASLEQVRAELAAANSLLAAIAELVLVPRPVTPSELGDYERVQRAFDDAQRDRAISVHVAASTRDCSYAVREQVLRKNAREDLGYEPKPPKTHERDEVAPGQPECQVDDSAASL